MACAHRAATTPPSVDARTLRWAEWVGRVEALPVCLPAELEGAPVEVGSLLPGDRVHVRGRLTLISIDARDQLTELVIIGRDLPDRTMVGTLREIDDAVGLSERDDRGVALGLSVGAVELALEPRWPPRVWRENDADLFAAMLSQTDAVVVGVVEAGGAGATIEPTRVCRGPVISLERERLPEGGPRWKLLDGLEQLSNLPGVSRTRRAQALRVLHDLVGVSDTQRAREAAERLEREFGDRSRHEGWQR